MTRRDSSTLPDGIERVLLTEDDIQARVRELGAELSAHYGCRQPLLVGVLTGAYVFMADLCRAMDIELDVEFMAVSSYGIATETSGVVRILKDLDTAIEGKEVLIVEDIIDSGLTLKYLLDVLRRRKPKDIRVVALLKKIRPDVPPLQVDYLGFEIPDEFVVGCGLDAGRRFRNLPYVAVVRTA
ncbi:MAG TPA: hypoxanthine phosphoribosyltransferase [Thermomicrobiales bacterium]|nr:hypoxanthine phosphoribosyltransferase [Thermomicrobiales bacterium]